MNIDTLYNDNLKNLKLGIIQKNLHFWLKGVFKEIQALIMKNFMNNKIINQDVNKKFV